MVTEAQAVAEQFEFVQALRGARSIVFDTLIGVGENGRLVRRYMSDREGIQTASFWSDNELDIEDNAEYLLDDYLSWYAGEPVSPFYQPPLPQIPAGQVNTLTDRTVISMCDLHLQSNDEHVWAGSPNSQGGYS